MIIECGDFNNRKAALKMACEYGNVESVKSLLKSGIYIDDGDTELLCASGNGYVEIVRLLIKYGAKDYSSNALFEACRRGHMDVVKELISHGGANIHALDNKALKIAIENKNCDLCTLLINKCTENKPVCKR